MDLESSAQLVAKAMSGNTAMLSRYGITVDQTKTKEEQRAEIMDKLEQFYGRATAETETYGGQLKQLKEKYGDIQEAVGAYITQNTRLVSTLNEAAEAILYLLALGDKEAEQKQTLIDMENRRIAIVDKMFEATNLTRAQMKDLLAQYDWNYEAVMRSVKAGKHGVEMQKALKDALLGEMDAVKKVTDATKKLEKGTNTFANTTKKAEKAEDKFTKEIVAAIPQARKLSAELMNIVPPIDDVGNAFDKTAKKTSAWARLSRDSVLHWSKETIDTFNMVLDSAMTITPQIGNLFQALSDRKMSALDKEYEHQRYIIEQSTMSEEEKNIALSKMEEEYNARADAIRIAAGKKQKKVQYAMAVMDAAGAIVNALNTHPFIPAGLIAAATATIMGGLQVATIASVPLARGGIFEKPTLLSSMSGTSYQVAEAGEKEVVAPLSGLRRELGLNRGGGASQRPLQIHLYLDGKELKKFIIRTIDETSRVGQLKVSPKAVTA
jgi:hypothetical protein